MKKVQEKEKEKEKMVLELFEAAKKAADKAAALDGEASEETRCIDALSQLKDFPITYQLLVSTQVGKQLRCLRKHPRKKIQAFACEVLQLWRNQVINTGNGDDNDEKVGKKNSVGVEPANAKLVYAKKVQETDMNERATAETVAKETVLMMKCNDALRDKVREQIYESLCKVLSEVDDDDDILEEVNACDPKIAAVSVESAMFECWGKSNGARKIQYRSTLFNIKDQNNPDFRRRILLGQLKPEKIVSMTTEEMASDRRKLENQQFKEKAMFNCQRMNAPPTVNCRLGIPKIP